MHPEGYHKDEDAKERCWGCSHPEKLEVTSADRERAKQLVAEGWLQISRKFCTVARLVVPAFEDAVYFGADVPEWLREHVKSAYVQWSRFGAADHGQRIVLTPGEFRAFKELGGGIR